LTVENISIDVKTNAGDAARQVRSLSSALAGVRNAGKSVANGGTQNSVSRIGSAAKEATKHTGNLLSSIKRIAMYRLLRTALKEVGKAFDDGLKNAYQFSKGIDGTLAEAMDSLATKSLTMKNQLGAAFGNLLTAITPILLQIINLVRMAAQALSALFSALGGGQYLIATDVAQSWDKATGAAKKYKNTILGFDEINRLDEPSGGGGGSAVDASKMFEVGELPTWAQFIKDHLEEIKKLAEAIGLAFLAWKVGSLLADLAGVSLSLSQLLGLATAVAGAFLLVDGAISAFKDGTTWKNVNEMLIGTALLAGGLALAFGTVGAGVGLLIGGVTLIAAALNDFIKTGKLSEQSLYAMEGGLLAVGAGLALLTGSWIPLAVAAIAGLALAIGTHTDEINLAVDTFFNDTILKVDGFLRHIEEQTGLDLTKVRRTIIYVLNYIRFDVEATVLKIGWVVKDLGRIVKAVADGDWDSAWNAMNMLTHDISLDVTKDVDGMAKAVTDDMMNGTESTQNLSQAFKDLLIDVRNDAPLAENGINSFTDAVANGATKAQTPLQGLWDKLTGILSTLQRISGISTTGGGLLGLLSGNGWNFSLGDVFGFASGGSIENNGSLFIAGEAGPEIVADMGSRTGVMNVDQMEAAVANGNIGVINAVYAMANAIVTAVNSIDTDITLDGESVADKLYRPMQNASNRYGSAMVT